jgi:hypothetical protein
MAWRGADALLPQTETDTLLADKISNANKRVVEPLFARKMAGRNNPARDSIARE